MPWHPSDFAVEAEAGKLRFHDLPLCDAVMHAIADLGFRYCSPIQAATLPHTLAGNDMVGKAQTGTGKTAAFLITVIEDLLRNAPPQPRYSGEARSLALAPTRELAIQIADDARALAKYTPLCVHVLVGGMDSERQRAELERSHCDILVATPGRLLDFCRGGGVNLGQLELLIIDEADRMLDMGFIPQVGAILRRCPQRESRQTLCFSATFNSTVDRLVRQWTCDAMRAEVAPESLAADTVEQRAWTVATRDKLELLCALLKDDELDNALIFANRRDQCRRLCERLQKRGFKVGQWHGEIPQQRRLRTLQSFKDGAIPYLVATDVAGRGIHIEGISHVINYNLPEEPEDYVHRIGRTGRAGKAGVSVSFVCEDDALRLEPIEKLLGRKLPCTPPPPGLLPG